MTTSGVETCEDCGESIEFNADPACPHEGWPTCPYPDPQGGCQHVLADWNLEEGYWSVSPFTTGSHIRQGNNESALPLPLAASGWTEAQKHEVLGSLASILDAWPTDEEPLDCYGEEAFQAILPHLTVPIQAVRGYSAWCDLDWQVYYTLQPDEARAEIAEIVRRLEEGCKKLGVELESQEGED